MASAPSDEGKSPVELPLNPEEDAPAVAVVAALLYVLSSLWMGLASFSDPGTIPPADAATRRAHGRGD